MNSFSSLKFDFRQVCDRQAGFCITMKKKYTKSKIGKGTTLRKRIFTKF